jgi:hypothetical protein
VQKPLAELTNGSLLQDEVLYDVIQVVEGDYPIGPVFLHALSTLVEASVLHETNFFNSGWDQAEEGPQGIDGMVWESPFVRQLVTGGALSRLPKSELVDRYFEEIEAPYDMTEFMMNHRWQSGSFSFSDIDRQREHLYRVATILTDFPGVFQTIDLTAGENAVVEEDAARLLAIGMPYENIVALEGYNRMVDAYVQLTRFLSLNLYLVETAIPHQLGTIHRINSKVRELYKTIQNDLAALDVDTLSEHEFQTVKIPDLARIVLRDAKGDVKAIPELILELRHRHRSFRQFLTEFDAEWRAAASRKVRLKLQSDFDNAWKTLSESEHKPKDRWFYKIAELLVKPTEILGSLLKKLVGKGREQAILGQVRGLTAIRRDLLDTPVAGENRELIENFRLPIAETKVWEDAANLGAAVQKYCETKV